MEKRAYQYDEEALNWYECDDADFLDKDIAELPLGFIVAWEPAEAKYLCTVQDGKARKILGYDASGLILEDGASFSGRYRYINMVESRTADYYRERGYHIDVSWRWRLIAEDNDKPIYVVGDVFSGTIDRTGVVGKFSSYTLTIDVRTRSITEPTISVDELFHGYALGRLEGIAKCIPILENDELLEAVLASVENIFRVRPALMPVMTNYQKIKAVLEHPYDVNITMLKDFIGAEKYAAVFPWKVRDSFALVCGLLGIAESSGLREAYECNPYAIVIYVILRQLGIQDERLVRRFYYKRVEIADFKLADFRYNYGDRPLYLEPNGETYRWENFCYYADWVRENGGEARLADIISAIGDMNGYDRQFLGKLYEDIWAEKEAIAESTRKILLTEGPTKDAYDMVERDIAEHFAKEIDILEILRAGLDERKENIES